MRSTCDQLCLLPCISTKLEMSMWKVEAVSMRCLTESLQWDMLCVKLKEQLLQSLLWCWDNVKGRGMSCGSGWSRMENRFSQLKALVSDNPGKKNSIMETKTFLLVYASTIDQFFPFQLGQFLTSFHMTKSISLNECSLISVSASYFSWFSEFT